MARYGAAAAAANFLLRRRATATPTNHFPWLRPDGKTQVTVECFNDKGVMVPIRVHTVLISAHHYETATNDEIAAALKEHVIKLVFPDKYLDEKTIFHLNPSSRFEIGGPHSDAGLIGRKVVVGRTLLGSGFKSSSGQVKLLDLSSPEMVDPPFPKEESQSTIWCFSFSITE